MDSLAGALRHSIYFLVPSRAVQPQGYFLLRDNTPSGIEANAGFCASVESFVKTFCWKVLKVSVWSKFKMDGEGGKK